MNVYLKQPVLEKKFFFKKLKTKNYLKKKKNYLLKIRVKSIKDIFNFNFSTNTSLRFFFLLNNYIKSSKLTNKFFMSNLNKYVKTKKKNKRAKAKLKSLKKFIYRFLKNSKKNFFLKSSFNNLKLNQNVKSKVLFFINNKTSTDKKIKKNKKQFKFFFKFKTYRKNFYLLPKVKNKKISTKYFNKFSFFKKNSFYKIKSTSSFLKFLKKKKLSNKSCFFSFKRNYFNHLNFFIKKFNNLFFIRKISFFLFINEFKNNSFFYLNFKNYSDSFLFNFFSKADNLIQNFFYFKNFSLFQNNLRSLDSYSNDFKKINSLSVKKNVLLKKKNHHNLINFITFPNYFNFYLKKNKKNEDTKSLDFFSYKINKFYKGKREFIKKTPREFSFKYSFKETCNYLFKNFFTYKYVLPSFFSFVDYKFLNRFPISKIFFFFLKNKKNKKKKGNFYFYFKKKLHSKKKNFFFKNYSFVFIEKKINNLFKASRLISTTPHDLFFFYNNPLFFKAYNFLNNSFKNNSNFFVSLNVLNKKIKKHTNVFTDVSLFSFNVLREIFQTNTLKKIKSFFSYLPYETMIKFIEYHTGKKVAIKIDPFAFKNLSEEDTARCFMWSHRLKVFKKNLGPRLFLLESLQIITLCLRLRDPYILSNWMLSMFYKISFWKYKMFLRYLQYILRNFYWPYFEDFNVKGIKFQLKGKVSVAGNARTRTVFVRVGSVSHSTYNYKVLTNLNLLRTFTGVIGFRTWLVF